MIIVGLIFAAVAAAFHVFIFALESMRWTEPATRKIFGIANEVDANTTKQLAFNQGFYNLFLALTTLLGIGLVIVGAGTVGLTLILAGTGMMAAAALVLILSDSSKARPAILQGSFPLISVIVLAIGLATH